MFNINGGFSNHVHAAIHPDGTVFLAVNQNNPSTRSKPRNVVIMRCKPGAGQNYESAPYETVRTYVEGVDSADAISASSLVIAPNGDLLVYLTRGVQLGADVQWVLTVDTIRGKAQPYGAGVAPITQKFNPPAGFVVYGGTPVSSEQDATGAIYWGICGRYGKESFFGMRAFKQIGNGVAVEVPTAPLLPGRGILSADGYLHGTEENNSAWRVAIPGFQPRSGVVAGSVSVPGSGSAGTDSEARAAAAQALQKATNAYNLADSAYSRAQSAQKAADAAKGTAAQAQALAASRPSIDDVWAKAGDRIFAELNTPGSPLSVIMWQKSLDGAYAFALERGLIKA